MEQRNAILELMNKNWIYEAIVTTRDLSGGVPRASAMGVSTPDFEHISLEVYRTSKTSENIVRDGKFIINFVMYVELFWKSVTKEHLEFDDAGRLRDADAWIFAQVETTEDAGDKIKINAKILDNKIKNPNFILINRAKQLTLESIIKFTKFDFQDGNAADEINENLRVIKKVAPGSKYEKIVAEILNKIEKPIQANP